MSDKDALVKRLHEAADWCADEEQELDKLAELLDEAATALTAQPPAAIDTCDFGHRFAKLEDHPKKGGMSRCPHCMAKGLDAQRPQSEAREPIAFTRTSPAVDTSAPKTVIETAPPSGVREGKS